MEKNKCHTQSLSSRQKRHGSPTDCFGDSVSVSRAHLQTSILGRAGGVIGTDQPEAPGSSSEWSRGESQRSGDDAGGAGVEQTAGRQGMRAVRHGAKKCRSL